MSTIFKYILATLLLPVCLVMGVLKYNFELHHFSDDAYASGYIAGSIFGPIIIASIMVWAASYFSKQKTKFKIINVIIIAATMYIVSSAGGLNEIMNADQQGKVALNAEVDTAINTLAKGDRNQGLIQDAVKSNQGLNKVSMSGVDAAEMAETFSKINKVMVNLQSKYQGKMIEVNRQLADTSRSLNKFSVNDLVTKNSLDKLQQEVTKEKLLNDERGNLMNALYNDSINSVKSFLNADEFRGYADKVKDNKDLYMSIVNASAETINQMQSLFNFMKAHLNNVKIENKKLIFDNNTAVNEFNGILKSIDSASSQETEAQNKFNNFRQNGINDLINLKKSL